MTLVGTLWGDVGQRQSKVVRPGQRVFSKPDVTRAITDSECCNPQ